jgi:hypothetical protein
MRRFRASADSEGMLRSETAQMNRNVLRTLLHALIRINIENVVASATVNQKLDLNAIVRIFPGVEYRPEQFPGLVYRLEAEDRDADLHLWEDGVHRSEVREASKDGGHEGRRRTQERRHSHPFKAGNPDPEHCILRVSIARFQLLMPLSL